ncbi:MAG TPA: hypothetical protein VFC78_08435 [Tepidisphaeraceae bacterium]|nr:hypothetical protein [Tepidisphaeraceae bacterium]
MRIKLMPIILLLLGVCIALAQPPAPLINPTGPASAGANATAALPANATVDQALDALDQRGKQLVDFTASVSITTGNPDIGNPGTDLGHVWFQKIGKDDGRIRVTFDTHKEGRVSRELKLDYLLEKDWLIDRNYLKKAENRKQVLKPGEKVNLLKLGEGPFPLPIGQSKKDVHKLFEVKIIAPDKQNKAEPADSIHLQLAPKPDTQFAKRFETIDVWVSRADHFPVRIATLSADEADERITTLTNVIINPPGGLKPDAFVQPPIDPATWSRTTEPYH